MTGGRDMFSIVADHEAEAQQDPNVYITSRGLKLKINKVSQVLIQELSMKIKTPKVPVVFIEDKGRSEENPNDPEYRQALMDSIMERGKITISAIAAFGVELIECPLDMESPDDDGWAELVEELGLVVAPKGRKARFGQWLRYYAVSDDTEMTEIMNRCMNRSFVTEQAVAEAADAFKSEPSRNTVDGTVSAPEGINGDTGGSGSTGISTGV